MHCFSPWRSSHFFSDASTLFLEFDMQFSMRKAECSVLVSGFCTKRCFDQSLICSSGQKFSCTKSFSCTHNVFLIFFMRIMQADDCSKFPDLFLIGSGGSGFCN